jgi:hypothetical protein
MKFVMMQSHGLGGFPGRSMILSVLRPGIRLKSKHQQLGGALKE